MVNFFKLKKRVRLFAFAFKSFEKLTYWRRLCLYYYSKTKCPYYLLSRIFSLIHCADFVNFCRAFAAGTSGQYTSSSPFRGCPLPPPHILRSILVSLQAALVATSHMQLLICHCQRMFEKVTRQVINNASTSSGIFFVSEVNSSYRYILTLC